MTENPNPAAPASTQTRRQAVAGIAVGMVACARALAETQQPSMNQVPTTPDDKRTSLHQEVDFKATPQRIYQALLSSKDFAAFTGAAAEIDAKPGGAFSLFGGMVIGRNIELLPNERIVQAWRVVADFPEGVYTMVKFELKPRGSSETSVILDQTGFAEGDFDHLSAGWHSHYWDPLKIFLAKP